MACSQCEVAHKERFYEKKTYVLAGIISGAVCLLLSLFWESITQGNHIVHYLNPAWIPIVVCGIPLFVSAFENLFVHKKVKSALLISIAMFACVTLEILEYCSISVGEHTHNLLAAGEIAFLMMIGEYLESITVAKSRAGIEQLYSLAPDVALVKFGKEFIEFPVSFVKVGDIVKVLPHSRISVDGVIVSGKGTVNQSAITGESIPVDKIEGDTVFAGTLNENSTLEIKVTKKNQDTVVSKMIKLVKEAEQKKAPIQRIADKWAGLIVPMAIILSVVVGLCSKLIFKDVQWLDALVRGITVLVVFCPCSLALATPTAISAGIGNASYKGILIKSGEALEKLSSVQTVVFDKTGTLTESNVKVDHFETSISKDEFLILAGSCEQNSTHPLAKAITEYCKTQVELVEVSESVSNVGSGVSARVNDKHVEVKKYSEFDKNEFEELVDNLQKDGKTVVGVGVDGKIVGVIALSDTIREGANFAVENLKKQGINTVMLTGDNQTTATRVANSCGIENVEHSLLPEQKVAIVESLKQNGTVLMVGDGVNDAPSLATADCSLAMGGIGSDVSLEVADMVLMNDKIEKVPFLCKLSKKTMSTIKRNIVLSMTINLVSVLLSFFGILTPALGAVVHNCSSVFVVFSSTLLLTVKE